jgi:predicted nucleotidyltransferase
MNFSSVIPFFEHDVRISAVYAMGSVVRGDLRPDSDIDLALALAPGAALHAAEWAALSARLTEALGRPVDLGLLSSRNLVYTRQAVLAGRCIYSRPSSPTSLMVATWLGLYARYQDDRQEVIGAYTAG